MFKDKQSQPFCKICFGTRNQSLGFVEALFDFKSVCSVCLSKMEPSIKKYTVNGYTIYGLHPYNDFMKRLIVQYKDFKDIALSDVFLNGFQRRIWLYYQNYKIVCVPSTKMSLKKRGFDHCLLMAESLGIEVLENIIVNDGKLKQRDKSLSGRKNVAESMYLNDASSVEGLNILVVDDVMTTGSSMLACLDLLEPYVNRVVGLVVAVVEVDY